jgi:hypothetical protein
MLAGHLRLGELRNGVPDLRSRGLPLFLPHHLRTTYARQVHGYTTSHLPHHEDADAKWNPFRPRGHHGLLQLRKLFKYRSRSIQAQLWTQVQLSRRFASACPTQPKKSSSGPTSTPNRNSLSPASSGTMPTSSHGARPTCLESLGSWLSTDSNSTRPLDLSSKSSGDLQKIENKP